MSKGPGSGAIDVLHVITSTQRRGAETFAVDLDAALDDCGLRSRVVALAPGTGGSRLDVATLGPTTLGFTTLRALRRAAHDAPLVIAHGSRTLPACSLALAGRRGPLAYRSIGDPAAWSAQGLRRRRTSLLLRRTAAVIALWPGAAATISDLHGVDPSRVYVIGNGVPAERFPVPDTHQRTAARIRFGLPADAPVVACIGALSAEKQVEVAVDAVATLPHAHLLVVGDGPQRDSIAQQATAAAPGRVHLAGTLDRPSEALAAADVVALPSSTEGLPGVLIEAGLSEVPVVASAVGGVAEVVRDGETGLLVPSGDVAALAAGITQVLTGQTAMGAAARRWCLDRFEIVPIAAQWADLIAQLTVDSAPQGT